MSIVAKLASATGASGTALVFDLQGRYLGTLLAETLRGSTLAEALRARFRNPGAYIVRYGNHLQRVNVK